MNKHQLRMPRWADEPAKCLERGLIPVHLLRPTDLAKEIAAWADEATKPLKPKPTDDDAFAKLEAFGEFRKALNDQLALLRERVAHFNLPYLSLPSDTSKDVALQVFINMNTNSKPLSLYDIIVAEVESVAERSLHDLATALVLKHPKVTRYEGVSALILSTSALLQDKLPNARGMVEMDKRALLDNWPKLERGLDRMASFLEGERIFDEARLPTNAVLAVIAACYEQIPDDGDFVAKAEKLLKRYLWSSFFSDRYENSAASRAYADFKALKVLLKNPKFADAELQTVPVLNRIDSPLADVDSLLAARWPKAAGIEARAILAVSLYLGANDFADHRVATHQNIQNREYHHIFPDALLSEAEIDSYLALNCALITWKTNRILGRKDPLDYLNERVAAADEASVKERMRSHLISYDHLSKAHYAGLTGDALKQKLGDDFRRFLQDRAALVVAAMNKLVEGETPVLETIWRKHLEKQQTTLQVSG
jgi:hypothetical protein